MPSSLSTDLRERVVAAVEQGASRHGAAARFGVSAASASRWHGQFAREGEVAAKPQGGDRRSRETDAHAGLILKLYEADPEIFLSELCEGLAEHGVQTSTSALSRFFARHAITRKKRPRTPPSRSAAM
jgi:transposase